jgi:3-oxoacyl-[acyl-carrier-protein] synthase II
MRDNRRVVITGLGVICATGSSVAQFLAALQEGRQGIKEITLFDCSGYPSRMGAQIDGYDPLDFFDKRELRRLSRHDQFVLIAVHEACADAGLKSTAGNGERSGVCLGVGAGGMLSAEVYHRQLLDGKRPRPSLLLPFVPSYATDRLAEHFRFQGPRTSITTACSLRDRAD